MPKSKKQKTQHNHQPYSTRQNQHQQQQHHHATNTATENLSHEEIWDDSALIRSWDDAVKEYEFYHSIHARGEDVDEVLRQAELAELEETRRRMGRGGDGGEQEGKLNGDGGDGESEEEGEIDEDPEADNVKADTKISTTTAILADPSPTTQQSTTIKQTLPVPDQPPPNPIDITMTDPSNQHSDSNITVNPSASAIQPDQTLENLKMAYYWAGYYSGLYDSQRGKVAGGGRSG